MVILCGPAGAGKSSFCAGFPESARVSLDGYRRLCTDNAGDQTVTAAAVQIRRLILRERMDRGLQTVADSTNTTDVQRASLIASARRRQRPVVAVLFHTPLRVCQARQADRPVPLQVPEYAVERMFQRLARGWRTIGTVVDLVVHVSPDGGRLVQVGDVPPGLFKAGRPGWLDGVDQVPTVDDLPWPVPFLEVEALYAGR